MNTRRMRHVASKRLLALAAVCVLAVAATSLAAAAPIYTDWTAPVSLGAMVNSSAGESGPALSPDGLSLFFYSNRPGGVGANGTNDIWVTQRPTVNDPWGPPINVGAPLNSTLNDQLPSLSEDGHWMILSSARTGAGGFGGPDLYQSYRADVHDDFGWETPTNLGSNVNSTAGDTGNAYFANGGHPQVYFGSDRGQPINVADLYVTTQQADGTWGPATLVPELNSSPTTENRPTIRADGLEIFFYSDRPGSATSDLWTATRPSIDAAWSSPTNLGAIVNSDAADVHPGLSADAKTLIFASTRTGTLGGNDLYMTTRAQIFPTTKDECKTGGWERFGIYTNQGDCVSYVATNGNNPPAE